MSTVKSTLLLSALAVSVAGIAGAADTWPVKSAYQEQVSVMLATNGYTSVRAVVGNETRLIAFDSDGSEVFLTMDPNNGTISASDYVYSMDR